MEKEYKVVAGSKECPRGVIGRYPTREKAEEEGLRHSRRFGDGYFVEVEDLGPTATKAI